MFSAFMAVPNELRKAARSLPWYLLGSYLISPLVFALFTFGASLIWYALPFMIFSATDKYPGQFREHLLLAAIPFAPGFILWIVRQYMASAVRSRQRTRYSTY